MGTPLDHFAYHLSRFEFNEAAVSLNGILYVLTDETRFTHVMSKNAEVLCDLYNLALQSGYARAYLSLYKFEIQRDLQYGSGNIQITLSSVVDGKSSFLHLKLELVDDASIIDKWSRNFHSNWIPLQDFRSLHMLRCVVSAFWALGVVGLVVYGLTTIPSSVTAIAVWVLLAIFSLFSVFTPRVYVVYQVFGIFSAIVTALLIGLSWWIPDYYGLVLFIPLTFLMALFIAGHTLLSKATFFQDILRCSECGSAISPEMTFCTACGNKASPSAIGETIVLPVHVSSKEHPLD